jgi:hypothetical protein
MENNYRSYFNLNRIKQDIEISKREFCERKNILTDANYVLHNFKPKYSIEELRKKFSIYKSYENFCNFKKIDGYYMRCSLTIDEDVYYSYEQEILKFFRTVNTFPHIDIFWESGEDRFFIITCLIHKYILLEENYLIYFNRKYGCHPPVDNFKKEMLNEFERCLPYWIVKSFGYKKDDLNFQEQTGEESWLKSLLFYIFKDEFFSFYGNDKNLFEDIKLD